MILFADFLDFGLKALDKQMLCACRAFPEINNWKEGRVLDS